MIPSPAKSVSVVVVAYASEQTISACIASIFEHSREVTMEVVVVDNSPDEQTAEQIARFRAARPELPVKLIRRPDNPGFAAGCNLGAQACSGDFLLFFNPDAAFANNAAALLMEFMQAEPSAAVSGAQILSAGGAIEKTCRRLPSPLAIFLDASGLDRFLGYYRLLHFDHTQARRVDQVIGACFMTRRDEFEGMGGFDERFFIYFEEVDYCKRVLDGGRQVWFRPEAKVLHCSGASCEAEPQVGKMLVVFRRSRMLYFRKHFCKAGRIFVSGVTFAEALAKYFVFSLLGHLRHSSYCRAKARGFKEILLCPKSWL